ncbi:hypothetical protein Syun_027346 [Stephania yunnanensis]|uniref:TF-B3 domain-containing protein n=1 Tax=Stephania yunnanensis TaxID=152371 RepID=A0AAP0EHS0_9MAGN
MDEPSELHLEASCMYGERILKLSNEVEVSDARSAKLNREKCMYKEARQNRNRSPIWSRRGVYKPTTTSLSTAFSASQSTPTPPAEPSTSGGIRCWGAERDSSPRACMLGFRAWHTIPPVPCPCRRGFRSVGVGGGGTLLMLGGVGGLVEERDSPIDSVKKYAVCKNRWSVRIPKAFKAIRPSKISNCKRAKIYKRGETWLVNVRIDKEGMWLVKGWEEFVKDNEVGHGDLIVFEYKKNMVFDVLVLNVSGSEKDCSNAKKTANKNKMNAVEDFPHPPSSALRLTLFKLIDPAPPDARDRFFKTVATFQGRLGVELSFGENFSPTRAQGFGIGSLAVFGGVGELDKVDFEVLLEKENDMDMVRGLLEIVIDVDFVVPASDPICILSIHCVLRTPSRDR